MTDLQTALHDLRAFVNEHLDGSTSRFLELDELVWAARIAANDVIVNRVLIQGPTPATGPKGLDALMADIGL